MSQNSLSKTSRLRGLNGSTHSTSIFRSRLSEKDLSSHVRVKGGGYASSSPDSFSSRSSVVSESSSFGDSETGSRSAPLGSGYLSSSVGSHTLTAPGGASGASSKTIDIERFAGIVKDLRPYAHTSIRELPLDAAEKLDATVHVVKSTMGTCHYQKIINTIRDIFSDVNPNDVKPNTVAAKFLGCVINTCPGIPAGCGPLCAGSIGNDPNLSGWKPCDSSVYLYDNGQLTILTRGAVTQRNAYIYVNVSFRGFRATEINALRRDDIEMVRIVHLDTSNGTNCKAVSPDFVPLSTLELRPTPPAAPAAPPANAATAAATAAAAAPAGSWFGGSGGYGGWNWWAILFVIFVIIVFALILWYAASGSKKTEDVKSRKAPVVERSERSQRVERAEPEIRSISPRTAPRTGQTETIRTEKTVLPNGSVSTKTTDTIRSAGNDSRLSYASGTSSPRTLGGSRSPYTVDRFSVATDGY